MSTLPELADRLNRADRFFRRWFGAGHNPCLTGPLDSITEVAAELRQSQPVNAEYRKTLLFAAQSLMGYDASYGGGGGLEDAWGIADLLGYDAEDSRSDSDLEDWIREAITRAESVEKAPAPVNQQMLDALRFARVFIGEEEPIITKRLDDAIARAESAEKAPDALTLSHEIQAKRGFSMGADSTPAQPDVVSGLVDALVKIRDWSSNSLDLVTCAGGQWDLQVYQESIRALNTFEAQSKAEPKA